MDELTVAHVVPLEHNKTPFPVNYSLSAVPGYAKLHAHLDDDEIERIAERVERRIMQKLQSQFGHVQDAQS